MEDNTDTGGDAAESCHHWSITKLNSATLPPAAVLPQSSTPLQMLPWSLALIWRRLQMQPGSPFLIWVQPWIPWLVPPFSWYLGLMPQLPTTSYLLIRQLPLHVGVSWTEREKGRKREKNTHTGQFYQRLAEDGAALCLQLFITFFLSVQLRHAMFSCLMAAAVTESLPHLLTLSQTR